MSDLTTHVRPTELAPADLGSTLVPAAIGGTLPLPTPGSTLPPTASGSTLPPPAFGSTLPPAAFAALPQPGFSAALPETMADALAGAIEAAETGPLPARPGLTRLFRFGVIGSLGFVWDTGTTYAAKGLIGLLPATLLAFVVAATLNWVANRLWTFRDRSCHRSLFRQWLLYMAANSLGFLLNRGTVAFLVLSSAFCHARPVIALAAGAVAGLAANFSLSHRVVFRHTPAV